jgi:hypothetical protein
VSDPRNGCDAAPEALLDYVLGELPAPAAERLEEHLFECAACAGQIEVLDRLRGSVARAARAGEVAVVADQDLLDRLARDGLSRREYRIPADGTVLCQAGPEDLVVVRLADVAPDLRGLRLEAEVVDLERDRTAELPAREVVVDRARGEVILVFPGEVIRGYPRSRWTMRLCGEGPEGPAEIGPFVMDHTP